MDERSPTSKNLFWLLGLTAGLLMIIGCYKAGQTLAPRPPEVPAKTISQIGFSIQAGAFLKVENAARLTNILQNRGYEATYFPDPSGFYKVRFGNFHQRAHAGITALNLKEEGIIEDFIIVGPEDSPVARSKNLGLDYLRAAITMTALGFLGLPYLWGGSDMDSGFDCSGLSQAVYQLNGIKLPRSSRDQYVNGQPVERSRLAQGDLVFFATQKTDRISHVGIYIGRGQFIHAPSQGKKIRLDSLDQHYYQSRFKGARSVL